MGKSSSQTVGFWYRMGLHFAVCYGPVDKLMRIICGEREAWSGEVSWNQTISIDAEGLFGGKKREGGIEGDLDVMMGGPTQTANSYLSDQIDGLMPAFRGILSLVYKGGKISANNPYVKPWAFEVQRILSSWHDETWYPETAPIYLEEFSEDDFLGIAVEDRPGDQSDFYSRATTEEIDYWQTPGTGSASTVTGHTLKYDFEGNFISDTPITYSVAAPPLFGTTFDGLTLYGIVRNLPEVAAGSQHEITPSTYDWSLFFYNGVGIKSPLRNTSNEMITSGIEILTYYNDAIYCYPGDKNSGGNVIFKFNTSGGYPATTASAEYSSPVDDFDWQSKDIYVNAGGVWWMRRFDPDRLELDHLDHDLNLIQTYEMVDIGDIGFMVCNSNTRVIYGGAEPGGSDQVPLRIDDLHEDGSTENVYTATIIAAQPDPENFKPVVIGSGEALLVNGQYVYCQLAPWAAMNPAHIVYQCLTDPNWGMGYPIAQIDDASFTAAADTFYAEGLGLCLIWNQASSIEDFIQIVLDHAGAVYFADPKTGKFKLKALRADYDSEYLDVYDESSVISVDNFQRPGYGETVNEITVVYRDHYTYKDSSITVQDLANIQAQGAVVSQTRQYPGLPISTLAARIAERDLIAASTPLARCRITVNRSGWEETPGNVIKLNWDKLGIDGVIFRVLTINYGTLDSGQLVIELAEDVYGLPGSSYSEQEPTEFVPPDVEPTAITIQEAVETPYWDIARALTAADLSFLDPDAAYIMAMASTSNQAALGFEMYTRIVPAVYVSSTTGTFAPTAVVAGSVGVLRGDTVIEYTSPINIDDVVIGQRAMMGSGRFAEFVEVLAIDTDLFEIEVNRGILDTTPQDHPMGTRIFFMETDFAIDPTERATGDSVDVRLSAFSGGGQIALDQTTNMNVEPDQRLYRPYPPGKIRVNTEDFPTEITNTITVTWAHRDRLQQLVNYVDQDEASIGPEAGTTYNVRVYLDSDLVEEQTGITGTTSTLYTFEAPSGAGIVEVEAVRDGLISWQAQVREFDVLTDIEPDPYWTSVTTLLHFHGSDGSTTFTDSKGARTWTPSGNAQIDTAQSKWGGSSGLFDGTGDYLTCSAGVIDTSDFTMEGWIRFNALGAGDRTLWAQYNVANATRSIFDVRNAKLSIFNGANGLQSGSTTLSTGQWYHIAFARVGATCKGYVNGVLEVTHTNFSGPTGSQTMRIGSYDGSNAFFDGWMDDVRFTSGVARYTANFTPPAAQFPDL